MQRIMVTGAAGFIGSTLAERLLAKDWFVIAVDNFNSRYNPSIKKGNVADAKRYSKYKLYEDDVRDRARMIEILTHEKPSTVVHLAGCSGIPGSLIEPEEYYANNLLGTQSVLDTCRVAGVEHFIFASSGSVYGETEGLAAEDSPLPSAKNAYVATKLLAEAAAHSYADVCGLKVTILRIFSVYGPRQREETAVLKFMTAIDMALPVPIYGDGSACRSFVYIEDCVGGIIKAIEKPFGFEIINLGGERSTPLSDIIAMLSTFLGKQAIVRYMLPPGELPRSSFSDNTKAGRILGYIPMITMEEGLARFVRWYKSERTT